MLINFNQKIRDVKDGKPKRLEDRADSEYLTLANSIILLSKAGKVFMENPSPDKSVRLYKLFLEIAQDGHKREIDVAPELVVELKKDLAKVMTPDVAGQAILMLEGQVLDPDAPVPQPTKGEVIQSTKENKK